MVGYQGEQAAGNYTVIPYETGKSFTYNSKIAYDAAMEDSDLMLKILGKQGKKELEFDPVKLGDGVRTTPYLMMSDDKVLMAPDAFQRITSHTQEATFNYYVNTARMLSGELREDDVKEMMAFMKSASADEKTAVKGMNIDAWASPEGELTKNENLADERAEAAKKWVVSQMKRNKIEAGQDDAFYALNPKGEDWDGFKEAMEASDMEDKELVLRVLEMYSDVTKREEEIKNMAATYTEIREDILPELRRSEMTLNYELTGKTDEELTTMSKTMPDSLNVEELLFAATLTEDMNEQLRIYKETERIYPNDYRGINNVGYIYMMQNKMTDAKAQFEKANSVQENPISTNNLGVIARLNGDRAGASAMYSKAGAAGPEVSYNQGLIDIQNGNYGSAISNMGGMNTFNLALAKLLNGDNGGAQQALEASADKDSAMGHYLMAIISARTSNGDGVRTHLAAAVAKDASLADKARKDLEFRDFQDNLGI
jgi:Flp pilus assembly protein TadD